MGSRKRGRKQKQQQRLVFEPIAETTTTAGLNGSALGEGLSLARVKFLSSSGKVDSPSGSRLARAFDMAKTKRSSKQQQTLEASLGQYPSLFAPFSSLSLFPPSLLPTWGSSSTTLPFMVNCASSLVGCAPGITHLARLRGMHTFCSRMKAD